MNRMQVNGNKTADDRTNIPHYYHKGYSEFIHYTLDLRYNRPIIMVKHSHMTINGFLYAFRLSPLPYPFCFCIFLPLWSVSIYRYLIFFTSWIFRWVFFRSTILLRAPIEAGIHWLNYFLFHVNLVIPQNGIFGLFSNFRKKKSKNFFFIFVFFLW